MSIVEKLINEIEACHYVCVAGRLENNVAWRDLTRIILAQEDEICAVTETIEDYQKSDNEKSALLFSLLNT